MTDSLTGNKCAQLLLVCIAMLLEASFGSAENPGRNQENGIYLCNLNGSDLRRIPLGDLVYEYPAFSPDGTRIAFQARERPKVPSPADVAQENFELPANTAPRRPLRHTYLGPENAFDIWSADIDGTNRRNLTADPANDYNPVWSPDGRRIAFVSTRFGGLRLIIMDCDGSNPTRMTEDDGYYAYEKSPSWRGNSDLLYISIDSNGNTSLCSFNLDTCSAELLWRTEEKLLQVASSPDGKKAALVIKKNLAGDKLSLLNLSSLKCETVFPPDLWSWCSDPAWSPDGSNLIFAGGLMPEESSDEQNDMEPILSLYMMEMDRSRLTQLNSNEDPSVIYSEPAVAPDGKTLLFARLHRYPSDSLLCAATTDSRGERRWAEATEGWMVILQHGELYRTKTFYRGDSSVWLVREGERLRACARDRGRESVVFWVNRGGSISWPESAQRPADWECFPDPWPVLDVIGVPQVPPPGGCCAKASELPRVQGETADGEPLCRVIGISPKQLIRVSDDLPACSHVVFVYREADGTLRLYRVHGGTCAHLASVEVTTKIEFTRAGEEWFGRRSGFWPFISKTGQIVAAPDHWNFWFEDTRRSTIVLESGILLPPCDGLY